MYSSAALKCAEPMLLRQAVGQTKGDELNDVPRVEVREVVWGVPAFVGHRSHDAPLEWRPQRMIVCPPC